MRGYDPCRCLPSERPSSGPLDLLLHLIEREDLDITAVSLVQVTDQYLAALRAADHIDLRALADFIAVGAKLIFLKSRALLPRARRTRAPPRRWRRRPSPGPDVAPGGIPPLQGRRCPYLRELELMGHRSFVRAAPAGFDWLPSGIESGP